MQAMQVQVDTCNSLTMSNVNSPRPQTTTRKPRSYSRSRDCDVGDCAPTPRPADDVQEGPSHCNDVCFVFWPNWTLNPELAQPQTPSESRTWTLQLQEHASRRWRAAGESQARHTHLQTDYHRTVLQRVTTPTHKHTRFPQRRICLH